MNKNGYIFKGALGGIAILAACGVFVMTAGYKKVLVKTASASEISSRTANPESYIDSSKIITKGFGPLRVKRSRLAGCNVMVNGLLNGREYPVRLDTGLGFSQVSIGANVAKETYLKTTPKGQLWTGMTGGICHLPILRLGDIQFVNPQSVYFDQHWEKQFLGVTVEQEKYLAVGLPLLMKFRYVVFDNINREVEFGFKRSFNPRQIDWQVYPFSIEFDSHGQKRMMVDIPIQGVDCHIMFDSCGGTGLKLKESLWQQIRKSVVVRSSEPDKIFSIQFGLIDCERFDVSNLKIGDRTVSTSVMVRPDNSPHIGNILSMDLFNDCVVVIDFEAGRLYVN